MKYIINKGEPGEVNWNSVSNSSGSSSIIPQNDQETEREDEEE